MAHYILYFIFSGLVIKVIITDFIFLDITWSDDWYRRIFCKIQELVSISVRKIMERCWLIYLTIWSSIYFICTLNVLLFIISWSWTSLKMRRQPFMLRLNFFPNIKTQKSIKYTFTNYRTLFILFVFFNFSKFYSAFFYTLVKENDLNKVTLTSKQISFLIMAKLLQWRNKQ